MRISLNWLSEYIDVAPIRADLKGVLGKLTMRGLEVETIEDLSKGFDKVVVAQIESRDQHPNADRLSVCRVNNGREVLQIVCGAQNMKAGDKVALSMIGAHLPNGVKIEKGKIRDIESFGMMCSETELGLADTSEGILILPKDAPLGQSLAPYIGRDDTIFEINVTPNRGDALSHIGVARELAAILGQKVKLPKSDYAEVPTSASEKLSVDISKSMDMKSVVGGQACLQYHGAYIEGVKIGPSPEWLKKRLLAVGLRPINNVVDVTNFVLMEWGQPLHAFDYAQIRKAQIQVRYAVKGEKLPLLDGTTVELESTDLVIADAERPVALAGVMGGANSEVGDKTTTILLETAQFDPSTIRRTARRYQKISDSSQRFERQIDAKAVTSAMKRAIHLIVETAGGKVLKGQVSQYSARGRRLALEGPAKVDISVAHANQFLGLALTQAQIEEALSPIGFIAKPLGADKLLVEVPSYRADIAENPIREDVYEEILRVWGYDRVEARMPRMDFIPDPANAVVQRARVIEKLKMALAEQGFSETVNFAFTSEARNARWGGLEATFAVQLQNALNEEFTTMKTSLLSGVIENLASAVRYQEKNVRLFEVRPIFVREEKSETGVREEWRVIAIMTGRAFTHALSARDRSVDFFDAKGVLETVLETIGARGLRYIGWETSVDPRLHPAQSAKLALGRGPCGIIGRLHPKTEAEYKFREPVLVFELSLDRALEVVKTERKFSGLSRFPKVDRDLSLLVPSGVAAEKITQTVQKLGKPFVESVSVVDTYSGEKIPAGTSSVSISMVLGDPNRTLAESEVDLTMQKILNGLEKELSVKLRLA